MVYKANRQIKDNDKVVLQVNHNFFMRETISILAKIFLFTMAYIFIYVLIFFAITSIVTSDSSSSTTVAANKSADSATIATAAYLGLTAAYLVIVVSYAARIINLHRKITQEEIETLSGDNPVKNSALAEKSKILEQSSKKDDEEEEDLF